MKKKTWQGALVFLMIGVMAVLALYSKGQADTPALSYADFWRMAQDGEVASVTMGTGDTWRVTLRDGGTATTPDPRAADAKERLLRLNVDVREEGGFSPTLLALALGAALVWALARGRRGAAGMQKYAAVAAQSDVPPLTFDDVAAPEETLRSLRDLADYLRQPDAYRRLGARAPKGVMLYGPPGTGKTLLARALAGEAHAPFFAMSGADFVQVYVGVGASRVRELFRKARKAGGGVIFIDEIDAIGKKREGGNDEREQTLNALLTEMSGFSGQDGVMVVAATNRLDTLDAALLREGRFDRRIEVGLPDCAQRLRILRVHARGKPIDQDVSLEALAARTVMFSGAQLETLLNEAAIRAVRRGASAIQSQDVEQAYLAVTVGEERRIGVTEAERRVTAYHEAGHALATARLLPERTITRVTIIPSARGAAGYAMSVQEDTLFYTKRQLFSMLCVALAGRIAEECMLGADDVTTGAADDLRRAREIARAMAEEYGMVEGEDEAAAHEAYREARAKTRALILEDEAALRRLADALMTQETLTGADVARLMRAEQEKKNAI